MTFTETAIERGRFDNDGRFFVYDIEGDLATINFYQAFSIVSSAGSLKLSLKATQTAMASAMQYAEDLERLLVRMTEKVERASQMHASGSHLSGEDWSELAMLAKETRAQLDQAAN